MVNSPSNPTGAVVEPEELLVIARLAKRRGSGSSTTTPTPTSSFGPGGPPRSRPEGAAAGTPRGRGHGVQDLLHDRLADGLGDGAGALAEACAALDSHSVQGPATFAQVAAAEALTGLQEVRREMAAEYRRRRDFIHPVLAAIPGVTCNEPEGGFYVFPNVVAVPVEGDADDARALRRLLEEKAVAVVPGEGFRAPGYLRLSFAAAFDELQEGARRIVEFLLARSLRGEEVKPRGFEPGTPVILYLHSPAREGLRASWSRSACRGSWCAGIDLQRSTTGCGRRRAARRASAS